MGSPIGLWYIYIIMRNYYGNYDLLEEMKRENGEKGGRKEGPHVCEKIKRGEKKEEEEGPAALRGI